MNTDALVAPSWSTASFGDAADTSPMELSALADHLDECRDSRGALFALTSLLESASAFLAPRIVSLLITAVLLAAVGSLAL
jgi:hypothetical protein